MDGVCAGGYGPEGIGDGEAAIVVAVPVYTDFFAAVLHDFVDGKFYEVIRALRSGMADGVAEDNRTGSAADGGSVEALHGFGIGADRVFGDEHGGEIVVDRELNGLFRGALEMVDRPVFD